MSSSATPSSFAVATAPSQRRFVNWSLNIATTIAARSPVASTSPLPYTRGTSAAHSGALAGGTQQVAHLVALRLQVADVVRVRLDLERHALDDLQAVAVEARAAQRAKGVEV